MAATRLNPEIKTKRVSWETGSIAANADYNASLGQYIPSDATKVLAFAGVYAQPITSWGSFPVIQWVNVDNKTIRIHNMGNSSQNFRVSMQVIYI